VPIYEFICGGCDREFREFSSLEDKKAGKIICPHCQSKNLQEKYSINGGGKGRSCSSCSGGSCSSCG